MHTKQVGRNLFLIDLQTGGFKDLIASYVLKGSATTIVESGPSSSIPSLLSGLTELGVGPEEVTYVAVSHIHLDHGGGVGKLLQSLPNAKVIVHPRGVPHLVNPAILWEQSRVVLGKMAEIYGKPEPVPEDRIISASDGMKFRVSDNEELTVVETLGHASHHQSCYESLNQGVFPGDAAGIYLREFDAVVPTSPPPFQLDTTLKSLEKLISLNPETLYYSHSGKASDAVRRLREYMRQLRLWGTTVKEGVQNLQTPEEIWEHILEEDETMKRIAPFLKADPMLAKVTIENSLEGFINWAQTNY